MRKINTIYYIMVAIILLACVVCLTGVIGTCSDSVDGVSQYLFEVMAVVLVMTVAYINSRLFRFRKVSQSIGADASLAVKRYISWNILRYMLAASVALFCLMAYCCTSSDSLSYGIGVLFVASLFWHPSESELDGIVKEHGKSNSSSVSIPPAP